MKYSPLPASSRRTPFGTIAIVLALSVAALIIRVSLARQGGLWRDEGLFLFVARSESWSSMLAFLRFHESHPPLFYAIMRLWMALAGPSDAAAQVIPIALGVALVPAIFLAGSSLFSRRVGLLAATLVALSPALAEHAAVVRPYSFLPLLALVSSYTLARGLERGGRRVWLVHSASTLAMLYTHNWALLVLGGQWVAAIFVLTIGSSRPKGGSVRLWIVSQLMIVAGYLPWIPSLVFQARHAGHAPLSLDNAAEQIGFVVEGLRRFLHATIVGYLPVNDPTILASATRTFAGLLLFFGVVGVAMVLRFRRTSSCNDAVHGTHMHHSEGSERKVYGPPLINLVTVALASWLAALVLSPRSNLLLTRCMVTLAPLLILALSVWLCRQRTGALAGVSIAAAALLVATYGASLHALLLGSRSNAREIALAVADRTLASDLLIIAPEWLASSFNLYYTPAIEQINFPHFGREGAISHSGVRARTADPVALQRVNDRIGRARAEKRRIWLLTERDAVLEIDPEEITTAMNSPSYGFVGIVRANQIRTQLLSVYGPPDTSITAATAPTRFENFRAYLFTVPGGRH